MLENLNQRIISELRTLTPEGMDLTIPPPIFEELRPHFVQYVPHRLLKMVVPAQQQFANPSGNLQGGILTAAFDAAFGVLAFLSSTRPATTVTLETSYIGPVAADGEEVTIEVLLRARTRSMVFLDGTAHTNEGQLAATAKATFSIQQAVKE